MKMCLTSHRNGVFTCYFSFRYMSRELLKHDILVRGYSSDADSKFLGHMKVACDLGKQKWGKFFSCTLTPEILVLQDLLHILTKIRKLLLQTSVTLNINGYRITLECLRVSDTFSV